jgi:phospholipid/cholesterol/gamma-HCH transport system substrate-binding protein
METRARYILVGAFTLFSIVAALGFLLWLARVQINRTYAQYDIVFDTVAGLSEASVVRYNGVDVGNVLAIALDTQNPALVRVRVEIFASTPVRADTVATLASQGVTGVSFVALEGGSPSSDRLVAEAPTWVPVIASKPSVVQELTTAAPDLLKEAIALIEDVREFTTPENTAAVTEILKNVESVTARVDSLAGRAETVIAAAETTLARADSALAEAEATFAGANTILRDDMPGLVADLKATIADVGRTAAGLEDFARTGLPEYGNLAAEARSVIASFGALANRVNSDPGRFLLGTQTPTYRN